MIVRVEREGKRIWLRAAWSPSLPSKCGSISGASWRASNKVWSYPLSYATCAALRAVFGDSLEIGPGLRSWAQIEKQRRRALGRLSGLPGVHLDRLAVVAPKLAAAMERRSYQQVGAAFVARAGTAINADSPGLGKTLEAIGAIIEAGLVGPQLVLAPKTAALVTWPQEIETWLEETDDAFYVLAGQSRKEKERGLAMIIEYCREYPNIRHWVLANTEMVRASWIPAAKAVAWKNKGYAEADYPEFFGINWSSITVDESHKSLVCNSSLRKGMTQQRCGLSLLVVKPGGIRQALSGTPFRGKLWNLWGTLNWLRPEQYSSFWRWAEYYFNVEEDYFSKSKNIIGLRKDREEEFYAELRSVMIRRTKREVVKELPEKQYAPILLAMEPRQKTAYQSMVRNALAKIDGGILMANGVLAETIRLKQFATSAGRLEDGETFRPALPSNKFNWLMQFFEDRGIGEEDGGDSKVVVASQFTAVVNLFAEAAAEKGVESFILTGKTSTKKRVGIQRRFQRKGGPRVFFMNSLAGGVSITLDAADELVLIDETYNPDDQEQVEDRVHRVSRIHQVTIYQLRSKGTIEEVIAQRAEEADEIQKHILDGKRGVEYAKQLIAGGER